MTISQIRTNNQLKQLNIATSLNVKVNTVCQWEKGCRSPKIEQLPKLAEVLNCSIEELVFALINTKELKNGTARK